MGFKKVYESLMEVFPQVDTRILRAIAIEHVNDLVAAVNDVLTDVIPFISDKTTLPSPDPCPELPFNGEGAVEDKMKIDPSRQMQMASKAQAGFVESSIIDGEVSIGSTQNYGLLDSDAGCSKQCVSLNNYVANDDYEQSPENTENTNIIAPAIMQEDNDKVGLGHAAPTKLNDLVREDSGCNDHEQFHEPIESLELFSSGNSEDIHQVEQQSSTVITSSLVHENEVNVNGSSDLVHCQSNGDFNIFISSKSHCTESNYNSSFLKSEDLDSQFDHKSLQNHSLVLPQTHIHSKPNDQESNASASSNNSFKQESSASEISGTEDGSIEHTAITQSRQLCRVDLLDEVIEDAKNNKITLFSSMESVINKMRELEHKEKAVEEVKAEAANGGWEILAKVEELKQRLARTQGANDMHAGEVFGERVILATEARELQSRLLSLSDERDKSLSILEEMHKTLEARIAAVDAAHKAAQEEKLAKEEHLRTSLAEQEAFMEKVVQESMALQQEAEENSKLRKFLMDRGQIVDTLQGEISVICQDVKHLKEKFDERVPLSKSLSSSQTTCILASSLKSSASELTPFFASLKDIPSDLAAAFDTPKNLSPYSSAHAISQKYLREERNKIDHKIISDDEWEVFDRDEVA